MKKTSENVLYSTLGVAAVFGALVAANFIASRAPMRIDLTAEKAYTLSPGTKAILAKLDTPVQIRFYCTRNESMPPQLKHYAQNVEDLLNEYKQASKGQIEIKKLNPEPDSDAEDSAKLDGVEGQLLQTGERLYLGLSVSMLDQKEAMPFLAPDRERLLEYDISRAVTRVANPKKPVVGILSPLPVSGDAMNPMMQMQGQQGAEPWAVYTELKRDFTVQNIPMTADKIPDEVKVLMVIQPRGITEATQYAIDQFVLRGGKLIAYIDPAAVLDRGGGAGMYGPPSSTATLDKLLPAWGVSFETSKTVADMNHVGMTNRGRTPGVLVLNDDAMAKDDIVTAGANNLYMVFPGAFSGTPAAGLKESVLIKSSTNSQLIEPTSAAMSPDETIKHFRAADKEFPLAIRLTGKFKTAFPNGKPSSSSEKPDGKEEKKDAEAGLKESAQENTVLLIGDSDMLQDPICVQKVSNPFGGGRMLLPVNGNLAFAQGAVEQLAGDENLIAVRGRATRERPFTVVKKMEADADAAYRSKIVELESSLTETRQKLGELQEHRSGEGSQQKFILSPEQQTELANFRKTEADVKRQLKDVRRTLRAETDALANRIKWFNIAGMPLLVAASGVGLAALKSKRTQAK